MIFIVIWSLWFISEILLNRLFRSGNNAEKNHDKGTIRIIWITIFVANTLGIVFANILHLNISNSDILPHFGLFIIVCGMIFRFIAIKSLGSSFTVDVTVSDNQKIKKDGIYSIIRHPSYTGMILSFIGFGISLNNWASLLIISIPVFLALLYRIEVEEKLLKELLGSEYSEYMKNTYRLIPWIY